MSTKRSASGDGAPQPKRQSMSTWLNVTKPKPPHPLVASPPFTDRRSTFVAHAAPVTTAHGAQALQNYVRELRTKEAHPREADHEMLGWRTMSLKAGRDGLKGEDDWTVKSGGDDDGEKGGGSCVKKAIEDGGGVDVGVVVSRWYGGIMLGQDRFTHIKTVTLQALALLEAALALPELLTRLRELDDEIASYTSASPSSSAGPAVNYEKQNLDTAKAERLIKAREKRLDLLKKKAKEEEDKLVEEFEKEGGDPEGVADEPEDGGDEENFGAGAGDEDWEAAAAEVFALMNDDANS